MPSITQPRPIGPTSIASSCAWLWPRTPVASGASAAFCPDLANLESRDLARRRSDPARARLARWSGLLVRVRDCRRLGHARSPAPAVSPVVTAPVVDDRVELR